ncbi:MAG TPA: type II toxin-antitoxin system HipA family toxin [Gammaproteobacteria bacterium]|nr:type II toxin-antitoxin system HipA family toxin [Gammaproteobacteria bacterium]
MADISVLNILLHGERIGALTNVGHDRVLFSFNDAYIDKPNRATLGLRFKDAFGELITEFKPTQTRLIPYFSNLLPEGPLRDYLSKRAGVNAEREFFLLWALGADLPGAITVIPDDDERWPSRLDDSAGEGEHAPRQNETLRFSLAGVQLKFSAIREACGGLTIPASGMGGSWIVKLPSMHFAGVPENEFSMMTLAHLIGIDVPPIQLVEVKDIKHLPVGMGDVQSSAFAIKRFDRLDDGHPVHIEDFAQVFDVYPSGKYNKVRSSNIARVIAAESNENDIIEFIRRLTFNTLIGNADMHVKNWSLIYPDQRHARLSPAYDFVSTIPYIADNNAALRYSKSKRFDAFSLDELKHLSAKALLPEKIVLDTARKTVALFHEHWQKEKIHLPLYPHVVEAIDQHIRHVPIVNDSV